MVDEGACRISYNGNGSDVPTDLARYIDHTLLKPDTGPAGLTRRRCGLGLPRRRPLGPSATPWPPPGCR